MTGDRPTTPGWQRGTATGVARRPVDSVPTATQTMWDASSIDLYCLPSLRVYPGCGPTPTGVHLRDRRRSRGSMGVPTPQCLKTQPCRSVLVSAHIPHEVSGAQCLSRRLMLAVFELVFVFSLGGPTPSEAAGGRPQIQRSQKRSAKVRCVIG